MNIKRTIATMLNAMYNSVLDDELESIYEQIIGVKIIAGRV